MTRTTIASVLFGMAAASAAAPQPEGAEGSRLSLDPPAAARAAAYRLSPASEGLLLSWHEPGDEGVRLCWSRLTDAGWCGARVVTAQRTGVVANWADVPAVVEGGDGAMYAHWLRSGGGASYDIVALRSTDGGETWRELGQLNDDDVKGEHGFVSYVAHEDGVRAYWLDGREISGGHGESDAHTGRMTLRTALVGETIAPSELVDDSVCDCCNTAAAATPSGPVVVYRDRAHGEIRDISIAGGGLGGIGAVHEDGWVMPGCPVNGPAIAADGERVVVVWYTGSPAPSIKAAFSTDGGKTFGDAIVVDKAAADTVPLGRVDVVLDGEEAVVCWLRDERHKGALLAQRVGPAGVVGEPVKVAPMEGSRQSGFPQMERLGDRLLIVWRDIEGERLRATEVAAASIGR
ncbi:MAG TPA: hypothetical protein VFF69_04850 [Phycisphaerales bacterium]|nr:hypothetical protein [Phycisphaerales bacterium]